MARDVAVTLSDVTFRYLKEGKRNILDHVDLTLHEGGITILMGSSGSGKSTLAAVMAGLYPENGGYLEGGEITLFEHPLSSLDQKERAAYLTMMFQNPDLQFCMDTLRKEMLFCLENIAIPPEEMDSMVEEAVRELGIEQLLDKSFQTMSGGEKQKASLACLFVMKSRIILLDEPFANIDRSAAKEIVSLLVKLKEQGKTILAIDHQVDLWADVFDEIIILSEGGCVKERGITRENLREHRAVFLEEGIFLPDYSYENEKSASTKEAAIEFRNFTIKNDSILLENASAIIPKESLCAIVGPSGSGKTTTFLALLKQHKYEGTIQFLGEDLAKIKRKELYKKIGIVFQNPSNQFVTQVVEEEVKFSLRLGRTKEEDMEARTKELLEDYGLWRLHRYSPYMLSQGQMRRLAVLSVLAGEQEILLLDEPTYGQDYKSTVSIMKMLKEKIGKNHLTILFITHDERLASTFADRVYRVEDRKLKLLEGV